MPIPRDVVRVRYIFDLAPGQQAPEQAVMGFHLQRLHEPGDPTGWAADTQEIADKSLAKWVARTAWKPMWPNTVVLNRVETYHLDAATGHTLNKGVSPATGANAWAGTSTDGSLPFEVAGAVSLYGYQPGSFTTNGKHKRGRFYLPPFAAGRMGTGATTGLFNPQNVDPLLVPDLNAFLNDIQYMSVGGTVGGLGDDAMVLGILSRSANLFTPAVYGRFGLVPDSQRRRRRSQGEAYRDFAINLA